MKTTAKYNRKVVNICNCTTLKQALRHKVYNTFIQCRFVGLAIATYSNKQTRGAILDHAIMLRAKHDATQFSNSGV